MNMAHEERAPREIIFFARLEERKGLLEFLDAVIALDADAGPDFRVTFLGKSVRLYSAATGRVESSEFIRQNLAGFAGRVTILTDLSSRDAIAHVRGNPSSIVCLASPTDNFPNSGLEMAQIAVPLVVSDTAGFRHVFELVGRTDGLFWFAAGSAASLRDGLARALTADNSGIKAPDAPSVRALNERLAAERIRLIEDAFAVRHPASGNLPPLHAVVLSNGELPSVRATLDSLNADRADFASITVRPTEGGEGLQGHDGCLLLVKAGTTLDHGAARKFLAAARRAGAAFVASAQRETGSPPTVRSFEPPCAARLLRHNDCCGACVLVDGALMDSLPPPAEGAPDLVLWQLALAAAAAGAKCAYIPLPLYDTATSTTPTDADLAAVARFAAAIPGGRWAAREIFLMALSVQQLGKNLRDARGEAWQRGREAGALQKELVAVREEAGAVLAEERRRNTITLEELADTRMQLALHNAELSAVYASKSWRMTGALRALYKRLRPPENLS